MREFQAPVKFLLWVVGIVMTLGLLGQLPKFTYKAAEMTIDGHENIKCPMVSSQSNFGQKSLLKKKLNS